MANKVEFGLSNVHVAMYDAAAGTYSAPVAIPGAVKLALAPEGDETEFYADNVPYFTATANQGYKGDLEVALLPEAVLALMLGWEVDDNGVLVELADGVQAPFALLGEIEGDSAKRRFAYYYCIASRPNNDANTKTKALEPTTQALSLTVSPLTIDDNSVVKGSLVRATANAATFDAWYTAVVTPTFASA